MKLVKQTSDRNCGAAALAMVLGLSSPEEVEAILGRECATPHADLPIDPPFIGVVDLEICRVLFERGFFYLNVVPPSAYKGTWLERGIDRIYAPSIDNVIDHISQGGVAILGVASLNMTGCGHWIVVQGRTVFDPSTRRCYETFDQIEEIHQAILVAPGRL